MSEPSQDSLRVAFVSMELLCDFSEGHFETTFAFGFGLKSDLPLVNKFLLLPLPAAVEGLIGFFVLLWVFETFSDLPPSQLGQRSSAAAGRAFNNTIAVTRSAAEARKLSMAGTSVGESAEKFPKKRREFRKNSGSLQGELKARSVFA